MWELLGSNSLLGTSREGNEPCFAWTPALMSGFSGTCFFPVGICFTGQLTSWTRKETSFTCILLTAGDYVWKTQAMQCILQHTSNSTPHHHTPSSFCGTLWPEAPPETRSSAHFHSPETTCLTTHNRRKWKSQWMSRETKSNWPVSQTFKKHKYFKWVTQKMFSTW